MLKCLSGTMKSGEKENANCAELDTANTPFLVHYYKVWSHTEPFIFLMDFFPVCVEVNRVLTVAASVRCLLATYSS